jgi:hypothetical protein
VDTACGGGPVGAFSQYARLRLSAPSVAADRCATLAAMTIAERWPAWWDAELFGVPYREADMALLESAHEDLKRLRLVRRRGRKLYATARGRKLATEPVAAALRTRVGSRRRRPVLRDGRRIVVDELSDNASHVPMMSWSRPRTRPHSGAGVTRPGTRRASAACRASSATSSAVARRIGSSRATPIPPGPSAGER